MIALIAGAAIALRAMAHRRCAAAPAIVRLRFSTCLATFAPAAAAVQHDPKQLLAWYPLAQTSRKLFPDAFKAAGQRRRRSISVHQSNRFRPRTRAAARTGSRGNVPMMPNSR